MASKPSAEGRRIMISCGEASGDLYAGALVTALRALDSTVSVCGFGGARMAAAGAELVGENRGFGVTGVVEAFSVLRKSWTMLRTLGEAAKTRRPDVFVAIDFPDFNFRLINVMHGLGIPVVYYISPQLWAWRPGRLEQIKKHVDRMLVIFPFEEDIYRQAGVPVEFVGHPLLDVTPPAASRDAVLRAAGLDPRDPVVALLPGSRPNELRHLLPVLVEAARNVVAKVPAAQWLVARAPALDDALFAPLESERAAGLRVAVLEQATDDVLAASDVVVTKSGTATVQAALHGRPMVIVYQLSSLTHAMVRPFMKLKTYGMVNLVAGRTVVPELIQRDFTPDRVAAEVVSLLTDRARADAMRRDLAEVAARFGEPGASRRAAAAVLAQADAGSARH